MLKQIWAMIAMSLRGLPSRLGGSLVIVVGVAVVVTIMVSVLGLSAGLRQMAAKYDEPDRVIVVSADSPTEFGGNFTPAQIEAVRAAPGIRAGRDGTPLVQPYAVVPIQLTRPADHVRVQLILRGTGPAGLQMKAATFRVVAGRLFRPGMHELVVGTAVARQFDNLRVGSQVDIRGAPWLITGIFSDSGGLDENTMLSDADTVLNAFGRANYQSIGVELQSPSSYPAFKDTLSTDPRIRATVEHLGDFYLSAVRPLLSLFNFVGYFIGVTMAIGAICAAVTIMYAAVDARLREMATLRAIGFMSSAVTIAVIVESTLLALVGAVVGVGLTAVALNQHPVDSGGFSFPVTLTPHLIALGALWAVLIGLLGGLAPSLRAARTPVATALRAT